MRNSTSRAASSDQMVGHDLVAANLMHWFVMSDRAEFSPRHHIAVLAGVCALCHLLPSKLNGSAVERPPVTFPRYKKKAADYNDDAQESSDDGYG